MANPCAVEGCNGVYTNIVISYTQLRVRNQITVEEYNKLESKKGYVAVIDSRCNVCNDDYDKRLIDFINMYL